MSGPRRAPAVSSGVEPTERALWALAAVGVVGLVSAGLTSLDVIAPAALGALGALLGLDFALATNPRSLEVRRALAERVVQGEVTDVTLSLSAPASCVVEVTDTRPSAATERVMSARVSLNAGETATLRLPLEIPDRGAHTFGRIAVRTEGPLGLLRRRARFETSDAVTVKVDLGRIATRAQRLVRGQDAEGARRRRSRDEGRDFESLREYVRGDDVRLIDWKATARRGHHVVRRMQPEVRQDVVILLDFGRQLSGRLDAEDGSTPRSDEAVEAALTLAAAALLRGDRVGVLAFDSQTLAWVQPGAGQGHLTRISDALSSLAASADEADYAEAVRFVLARQKRRAMMVLVTDVVDEPSARGLALAVARLRGRHLPLVLAVKDAGYPRVLHEAEAASTEDAAYIALAAARLLEHRRRGVAAVQSTGAHVIDSVGHAAAAHLVRGYLDAKSAGRL